MTQTTKQFKHYDTILGLFVAILIISNIASTKLVELWRFTFDGGTILFPLSYIFGDILTEVYGYKRSRKVIWIGFISITLLALTLWFVQLLPAAADWAFQQSFEDILGFFPRIVLGSVIAYFAGEFSNSIIMAKLKIYTKGKMLWLRTIGSTLVGEGIDTILFILIAFYGIFPNDVLWMIFISNYIFKCLLEILLTPATYKIVNFLKKQENVDVYDYKTNFNPFKFN